MVISKLVSIVEIIVITVSFIAEMRFLTFFRRLFILVSVMIVEAAVVMATHVVVEMLAHSVIDWVEVLILTKLFAVLRSLAALPFLLVRLLLRLLRLLEGLSFFLLLLLFGTLFVLTFSFISLRSFALPLPACFLFPVSLLLVFLPLAELMVVLFSSLFHVVSKLKVILALVFLIFFVFSII